MVVKERAGEAKTAAPAEDGEGGFRPSLYGAAHGRPRDKYQAPPPKKAKVRRYPRQMVIFWADN